MIIFPPAIVKSNITKRPFSDIKRNFEKGITVIDGVTLIKVSSKYATIVVDDKQYRLVEHNDKIRGWYDNTYGELIVSSDADKIHGEIIDSNKVAIYKKYNSGQGHSYCEVEYVKAGRFCNGDQRIYLNFNGATYNVAVDTIGVICIHDGSQFILTSCVPDLQTINPFNDMTQQKSHYLKDNIVYDFPVDGSVETPVIIAGGKVYTENTALVINTRPKEEIEKEQRLNKILASLPTDTPEWVKAAIGAFAK